MSIGDRVKQIRMQAGKEGKKLTLEKFGERISVTNQAVSAIESGRSKPSNATIDLICREFNINRDWLLTGEGDMHVFLSSYDYVANFTVSLLKERPGSFKNRFIKALSELSEDDWKTIEDFAKKLSEP